MPCPHCGSGATQEQATRTSLGYRTFRCIACRRRFNERSGTPFNELSVPTDIVFLVVHWRLRYPLSLRHLAEMFLDRGFVFSHETVRSWEALVAPLLTDYLRAKRRGKAGLRWHADETSVKVHGVWCYLYRAIDADDLGGFSPERASRYGRGQAIFPPGAQNNRSFSRQGDD